MFTDRLLVKTLINQPAPASPLLMLWHLSPDKAKRKVSPPSYKGKVSLGPSTVLVTNRPPGNGRRLDSSRESYISTSWPLVPDLGIQRTIINSTRYCLKVADYNLKGRLKRLPPRQSQVLQNNTHVPTEPCPFPCGSSSITPGTSSQTNKGH